MSEVQQISLKQLEDKEVLSSESQTSEVAQNKLFGEDNEREMDIMNQYPIPEKYNVNKLVLQIKNPKTAHLYWEYTLEKIEQIISQAGYKSKQESTLILRVYNLSLSKLHNVYYDISINFEQDNWYLNDLEPGSSYIAELGVLDQEDNFSSVLKSNKVKMPYNRVTDRVDEEWMTVEETMDMIYILSGALPDGTRLPENYSSADVIKKQLKEVKTQLTNLKEGYSSLEVLKDSAD